MEQSLLRMASVIIGDREEIVVDAYKQALNVMPISCMVLDLEKRVMFMNTMLMKSCKITQEQYKGMKYTDLNLPISGAIECTGERLEQGFKETTFFINEIRYNACMYNVYNDEHVHIGYMQVITLLGESYDQLTGIYSRIGFTNNVGQLLADNPTKKYVFILWNFQKFKVINELFGKAAGDAILIRVSKKLHNSLKNIGTCARFEGDNFMICVEEEAFNLKDLIEKTNVYSTYNKISIKSKFGIYYLDDRTLSVAAICDRASLALQSIRDDQGKIYGVYNEDMLEDFLEEYELAIRMDMAIENKEFEVYYQPIYNISKNQIVSAEALIRWNHPERGMVGPNLFIPIFEQNGSIVKLDRFVWREVCEYIKKCKEQGKHIVPISVNISRADFHNPELCEELRNIAKEYEIPDELLRIEMTETAYSDNPDQLLETVKKFQDQGFKVLMDDFGSGFSSLNILKDIPVDILKIDLRFLEGFESTSRASSIISSVIRMGKWLGLKIVAEGVETKAQLNFLKSVGCDNAQGYLFSRPVQAHILMDMLQKVESNNIEQYFDAFEEIDFESIWSPDEKTNLLFDGIVGGLGLYELIDDELEVVRVNTGYYEIMGGNPQLLFGDVRYVTKLMSDKDKKDLITCCRKAENSKKVETVEILRKRFDGIKICVEIKMRFLGYIGNRSVFYFAIKDITKQKEREKLLFQNTKNLQTVLEHNDTCIWEYDVKRRCIFQSESSVQMHGFDEIIENVPESLIQNKFVHPDDENRFLEMYDLIHNGQQKVGGIFRVRTPKGDSYVWEKISYIVHYDEEGAPMKAFGFSSNVSEFYVEQYRRGKAKAF